MSLDPMLAFGLMMLGWLLLIAFTFRMATVERQRAMIERRRAVAKAGLGAPF